MSLPSDDALLELALDAAESVAPRATESFVSGVSALTKTSRHDLVSEVDRAVEDELVRILSDGPAASFLGEEHGLRGEPGERLSWVIDPIDGTSNFVHGDPSWAVSIAACLDGVPVAGVVHAPARGLLFAATRSTARLNDVALEPLGRGEAARCALATDHPGGEAVLAEGDPALRDLGALITSYATVRRPVCASLSLAAVAAGVNDVVLGVDVKPWDVAAGSLMVRSSGGEYVAADYASSDAGAADPLWAPCYVASAPGAEAAPAVAVMRGIVARRDALGYRRPGLG